MSSWSIKKSINVLAAAMLGVLVIISVVGIGSTLRLTAATEQFSDAAQQTKDLAELEGLLLEGRLAAVLYRMSATEERAEIVVTNLSAILEAGAQLGSLYVGDPEMLEKLDQLKADLVAYKDHFSAMRDLRAEREAHVAVTTAAGKEARELITSIIETPVATISPFALAAAGLAQQNFILSRLYLERFLLTNEQAAFETSL